MKNRRFEKVLRQEFLPDADLMILLKDGVYLCEAFNVVWPDSIGEIVLKKTSLAAMQNVASFLEASELCGVPKECLFESNDLLQGKNPMRVLQTIFYLNAIIRERAMKAPHIPDWYALSLVP
jgi:hypothetical protein